jgi:hypothetical protein
MRGLSRGTGSFFLISFLVHSSHSIDRPYVQKQHGHLKQNPPSSLPDPVREGMLRLGLILTLLGSLAGFGRATPISLGSGTPYTRDA